MSVSPQREESTVSRISDKEDGGEPEQKRAKWTNKIDFLLACIGFSVGLGNVWRFPYLCYRNGGGAFLIPYFIAVFLGGGPVFFLEVALGQMMSRGGIEAWNIIPILKGIGFASVVILFFLCCYYNVILSWAFFYLFSSFTTVLPWSHCDSYWNTANCTVTGKGNFSNTTGGVDSVTEFWNYRVLDISTGISDIGTVKWDLALCLLLAWIVVFLCIIKGIKSSGKVMYITATSPYLFMLALLIRSAFLEGAAKGVRYYMVPQWERLSDLTVWVDAGTQIFFSYSISLGTLTALGSYNEFRHNAGRDCLLFALVNSFTSIFAGFVIFMTLGYMSEISGTPIDQVAESGPGLAFIAYPKALAQMPGSPVWSVLFFVMVLLLGLDSQFVGVEGFVTALADLFPQLLLKRFYRQLLTLAACIACFLVGLSMVTNGGMYVFQIFDYYSGSRIILLVAFFECAAIGWIYGVNRFSKDIARMFPFPVAPFFKVMWCAIAPVYVLVIFAMSVSVYSTLTYTVGSTGVVYVFPEWSIALGWIMACSSVVLIPIYAIYKIFTTTGTFTQRIKYLIAPQYSEELQERLRNEETEERGTEVSPPPYNDVADNGMKENSESNWKFGTLNESYTVSTTAL